MFLSPIDQIKLSIDHQQNKVILRSNAITLSILSFRTGNSSLEELLASTVEFEADVNKLKAMNAAIAVLLSMGIFK